MTSTEQQIQNMRQLSAELIDLRPSVMRTGAIVLLLRIVTGLLSLGLYGLGILLLVSGIEYLEIKTPGETYIVSMKLAALGCITLGLLLNTVNWLCRLIRRRNWYILHSFEVIDWVSALKPVEEKTSAAG